MNFSKQNPVVRDSGLSAAEETLRLIASLPAPEGLERRIEASLQAAPRKARILSWPVALTLEKAWVRAAAAAAIVFVVAGGGWGVVALVQPSQPARVTVAPPVAPHGAAPGGFSNAGAMRTPQTLDHPVVAQPVAAEPTATPAIQPTVKPIAKPATQAGQKPLQRAKSAATGKPVKQPAASTKKQPDTTRP
jgi:hypothetical protein